MGNRISRHSLSDACVLSSSAPTASPAWKSQCHRRGHAIRWAPESTLYPAHPKGVLSSVQSLRRVQLFATPWTAARQASLSITISRSWLRLMSIESVRPSNHLILGYPLLLPSIFTSIWVFSSELVRHIRWPKYWSFSFSISPSNE